MTWLLLANEACVLRFNNVLRQTQAIIKVSSKKDKVIFCLFGGRVEVFDDGVDRFSVVDSRLAANARRKVSIDMN